MPFVPGDTVTILKLKKTGTVVQVLGRGKYAVTVGKIQMTCQEGDLRILHTGPKRKKPQVPAGAYALKPRKKDRLFNRELDLHGANVQQALELTAQFISDAIMAGHTEVRIIHGIGTGKLKDAIHQYLSSETAVKAYSLQDFNAGTTRVILQPV